MKKFNELKINDIVKVNDYTLKVTKYNEQLKGYHLEGKKKNDCSTYIGMLISEEDYNKMDEISKLYCISFDKVSEVL
jgi:hypothetical protein